jgi:hypothetical protein
MIIISSIYTYIYTVKKNPALHLVATGATVQVAYPAGHLVQTPPAPKYHPA